MTRPDFAEILYPGHPAIGTRTAAYQFMVTDSDQSIVIVEANTSWEVVMMEKLLLRDGMTSISCRILAIFRDTRKIGVRDSVAIREMSLVDFFGEYVDLSRVSNNHYLSVCWDRVFTSEERINILKQAKGAKGRTKKAARSSADIGVVRAHAPESNQDQSGMLTSALCEMGFNKSEVKKFVNSLGEKIRKESFQDLIREGLRNLAVV